MKNNRRPLALLVRRVHRLERLDVRFIHPVLAPERESLLRDNLQHVPVLRADVPGLLRGRLVARAVDEPGGLGELAQVRDRRGRVVHAQEERGEAGLGERDLEDGLVHGGAHEHGDDGHGRERGGGRVGRSGGDGEADGGVVVRDAVDGARELAITTASVRRRVGGYEEMTNVRERRTMAPLASSSVEGGGAV